MEKDNDWVKTCFDRKCGSNKGCKCSDQEMVCPDHDEPQEA